MAINFRSNTIIRNLSIGPLSGGGEGGGGGFPIESSGLQLFLDAANSTSYSGTGNTWIDLSGNGNDFTAYTSAGLYMPTYVNAGDASYFDFDDSTGTAMIASNLSLSDYGFGNANDSYTVNFWAKGATPAGSSWNDNQIWFNFEFPYSYTDDNGNLQTSGGGTQLNQLSGASGFPQNHANISGPNVNTPGRTDLSSFLGSWHNYSFVFESGLANGGLTITLYIDGTQNNFGSTTGVNNITFTGTFNSFTLSYGTANSYGWNGDLANFALYNRALSASEVLANYNALSSRF